MYIHIYIHIYTYTTSTFYHTNARFCPAPPAGEAARHCWEGAGGAVYGSAVKQLAQASAAAALGR